MLDLAWRLLRPLLFAMEAEHAHDLVIGGMARFPRIAAAVLERMAGPPPPGLRVHLGPLDLPGPVGLAAGLDKDGEAVEVWPALGFGFVEVGTVTPLPQAGNPRPRLFRLAGERALVNRMGFNNGGAAAVAARLRALRDSGRWPAVPVGVNVGKGRDTPPERAAADYALAARTVRDCCDYVTANVSSPNTPGLRDLARTDALFEIVASAVEAAAPRPLFVKLSPDEPREEVARMVSTAIGAGCAGIVATNTTQTRPGTTGRLGQDGGLSGAPLWSLARERIGTVVQAAGGRVPVVGCGGIGTAAQVAELLGIGCAAVQVYSALIFDGPGVVSRMNRELAERI